MDTAISVSNLSKTYSSGESMVKALDRINFEVKSGEIVLLLGPSGSGKTTLISIIGCMLRQTSGSVRIYDKEVSTLSQSALPSVRLNYIGFVFQGFNLFPNLTARENIELILNLKGIKGKKARQEASQLLDSVGLNTKYKSYPADLSGGQKQRVAIARALAGSPKIILADEPTAALDSYNGQNVMQMMYKLAKEQNRAVVIVTHDSRTFKFADRIAHIEDGKLSEDGDHSKYA